MKELVDQTIELFWVRYIENKKAVIMQDYAG